MSELNSEWLVEDRPDSALWQLSLATFAWFNEHIVSGDRVLDYGSGSGAGTVRLKGSVTGVDVSDEAISYARAQYPDIDCIHVGGSLPFPDESFDVVCSSQVIEHVEPETYLREARRVLKPGGVILVVTIPREERLFRLQRPWNPYHVTEYSRESLVETLSEHFEYCEYFPMRADGEMGEVENRRWSKNRLLSLPFTLPVMPDRWRRDVILWLSNRIERLDEFGKGPNGTIWIGEPNGFLVNHCVRAYKR